ncbi:unnamed protein product [Rotaria sordida]|uniref:Immediate early response 3-interacting protein 1 n=1 Tax=Rotaria sordida TaxID=392033 RepID=A0A814FX51_9BILA|nr:unnamed protein product [Rotaria sordida]CAF0988791.1 unnamed protein product [Rotaria sordida]CAF0996727.1 unnamed protein product [Rotaria sordida]CAF1078421.1 unnamed protein product [Rotaria sordida]CAF1223064.1 unnamed protein product [Rotaria sordida]
MGFTLYSLIEAALLCVNAIAILNEQRFLSRLSGGGSGGNRQGYPGVGGYVDDYQNVGGTKQQLLNLIRSVRTVMRVPLIAFNIVTIIFLILFG